MQLFTRSPAELKKIGMHILDQLRSEIKKHIVLAGAEGRTGSGAFPVHPIPSVALQIQHPKFKAEQLARRLRQFETPVFGYIENDVLMLNLLTLQPDETEIIVKALNSLL